MNEQSTIQRKDPVRSQIYIGRHTYGLRHENVIVNSEGYNLHIGRYCSIGRGVLFVLGGNHRTDWASTFPFGVYFQNRAENLNITGHPQSNGDINIGHDIWLALESKILSGVTIGNGAAVGAGSVVTKDIGAYEIWAGNPARFIKKRFDDDVIAALQALKWWEFDVDTVIEIAPLLSQAPTVDLLNALGEKYADRREIG